MKSLFAICALFVIVTAQPPPEQRCTRTPPQWEGFFYENDFTAEGLTPYVRFASVEYDATDEMVRIIEFDELNIPGRINSFKQEEIYHFKDRKQYTYNYVLRRCIVQNLEEDFRPFGVINDAEFRGRTWLGVENVQKLGLDVDHFFYTRSDDDAMNHHYSSYWVPLSSTEESVCVPVEQHFINLNGPRERGPQFDARFTFLNITTVTDFPQSTFVVPDTWDCRQ